MGCGFSQLIEHKGTYSLPASHGSKLGVMSLELIYQFLLSVALLKFAFSSFFLFSYWGMNFFGTLRGHIRQGRWETSSCKLPFEDVYTGWHSLALASLIMVVACIFHEENVPKKQLRKRRRCESLVGFSPKFIFLVFPSFPRNSFIKNELEKPR